MKKRQIISQNMYQSLVNLMLLFKTTWTSNSDLSNVVTVFTNMLGLLNLAGTNQKNLSKGITQTKAQARSALIQMALAHSAAGIAYAVSAGNTTLKVNSKLVESKLNKTTDVALADTCQNLYNLLNPFAASLTNFGANAATLTAFQTAITDYQPLSQQLRNVRSAKKTATLNVAAQIAAMDTIIKEQLDPLMVQFKTSAPDFYTQYVGLRHAVHTSRHLKVVSIFLLIKTAAGVLLPNANIKLNSTRGATRNKFSKANGSESFTRLKPDTFTITVSLPGYVTQTQTITVPNPQKINVNFSMVAST